MLATLTCAHHLSTVQTPNMRILFLSSLLTILNPKVANDLGERPM